jgi:hypothetical protein
VLWHHHPQGAEGTAHTSRCVLIMWCICLVRQVTLSAWGRGRRAQDTLASGTPAWHGL